VGRLIFRRPVEVGMKRLILVLVLMVAAGSAAAGGAPADSAGDIDLANAARWFAQFDSLCTLDGGRLWGASFRGPIMIVDVPARKIVTNRPDSAGVLTRRGDIFVGDLPPGVSVANTATTWLGTRWTMIMLWSLSENTRPRLRLMGHESFHRLQPQLRLEATGELNEHLDTADGRFWLQLEWNALQQALLAQGEARREAIADALSFRAARRKRFPGAAERERWLEIQEGLAEYSGMRLAGYSDSLAVRVVVAKRADETGFVRSFAYVSGPLYGYLLDGTGAPWRASTTASSDLGGMLAAAAGIRPRIEGAESRARGYGGDTLRVREDAREIQRRAQLATWRRSLVEGPALIVDLKLVRSGTFDPGKVFPFADGAVVYTSRALEAAWGTLSVDEGAILEDQKAAEGRVSLAGAASDHRSGRGWNLKLADGWAVRPGGRAGDLRVVREVAAPSSTPLGTRPTLDEVRRDMVRPSTVHTRGRLDSTGYALRADQMARVWERSAAPPAPDSFDVAPAVAAALTDTGGPGAALVICPHDDFSFAGRVYRRVMPLVHARTVVLVGVFHRYRRFAEHDRVVFDPYDAWTAPDGPVPVSSLRGALLRRLPRADWTQDTTAHDLEHSLEPLVCWLRHVRPDVEIVPIIVPASRFDRLEELGDHLAVALAAEMRARGWRLGRDVAIAVSADAIHYGPDFNQTTFGGGIEAYRQAVAKDHELLTGPLSGALTVPKIRTLYETFVDPETPDTYRWTWCGRFSVPLGLLILERLTREAGGAQGVPIAYGTSIGWPEVGLRDIGMAPSAPSNLYHFVGYPGVAYLARPAGPPSAR
jgi:AmmeMemoRadiSam system protein B